MKLATVEVEFFRRSGYLKLPAIFGNDIIHATSSQIKSLIDGKEPPFRTDAAGNVSRLDCLYQRGGPIRELMTNARLLDALESLLGPNIELCLNRHNHATTNHKDTASTRLHRDILQWSRALVTAIVYLEDATILKGCTHLIPTSQYLPFVGTPNNGGTWMDEHSIYADQIRQALPCPMSAGSVLLIDSLAFHAVGQNQTDSSRLSIALGYHSADELDPSPHRPSKVLVRGKRLYRGNDKA